MNISALRLALCLLAGGAAASEGTVIKIDTRPGISITSHYLKRDNATATLLLFTGGGGSIALRDGEPRSINFLIRNRGLFAAQGFNVFSIGRPTDKADLDGHFRSSPEHVEDIRKVVAWLKADTGKPVWLVGTSTGTISVAAGAIGLGNEIAGAVLTSSITSYRIPGAPGQQALENIRVPVLVMHHERDQCHACLASGTGWIMRGLKNAAAKKLLLVDGGKDPTGDPCEPLHWHGYINMDDEAVRLISDWIRQPGS